MFDGGGAMNVSWMSSDRSSRKLQSYFFFPIETDRLSFWLIDWSKKSTSGSRGLNTRSSTNRSNICVARSCAMNGRDAASWFSRKNASPLKSASFPFLPLRGVVFLVGRQRV